MKEEVIKPEITIEEDMLLVHNDNLGLDHFFRTYEVLSQFNIYGSVHRNNILIYIQQDATLHSLFYLETALYVLCGYHHPSSGAQTTVSTASGICHTVTATCRHCGRGGTGLSVLWVAWYATHNTLKSVKTLPRWRQVAVTV